MARKIKFALEMAGGVKVRSNLEELRENFDIDKAVGHFLSGKLIEWLEDRYYEDEAEKISALDKDSPDFRKKLCDALGVDYVGGEETDVEFLERLNEKKNFLRQKTDDKNIVANADKTALNQEDLSDLLDMDEPTIYLCGENFNIPIRVENKKYIGILGTPKITIKANSQAEIDAKNISFENCILPFAVENFAKVDVEKSTPTKILPGEHVPFLPKKQLIEIYKSCGYAEYKLWHIYNVYSDYSELQKKILAKRLFDNEYLEEELVCVVASADYDNELKFFAGFALTIDSLCYFYETENKDVIQEKIEYNKMKAANFSEKVTKWNNIYRILEITTDDGEKHLCGGIDGRNEYGNEHYAGITDNEVDDVKKFLDRLIEVKNYM